MGTPNGVLVLNTGNLRAGTPEDKIRKSTNVEFDPNALCPRWELFLTEIFDGDIELIDFIRRSVGYSLTGSTADRLMFMCYGKGANGKSVFFGSLKEVPWGLCSQSTYEHECDGRRFLPSRENI